MDRKEAGQGENQGSGEFWTHPAKTAALQLFRPKSGTLDTEKRFLIIITVYITNA